MAYITEIYVPLSAVGNGFEVRIRFFSPINPMHLLLGVKPTPL